VDHLVPDEVSALADRLRKDFGTLDILVNDIWGAEKLKGPPSEWKTPIWKHDPTREARGLPVAPPPFAASESPRYVGRAVAALALDANRSRWNQKSVSSGQLAKEYGFTDLDGSQPDIWSRS
jgi:hypothetical protein